MKQWSDFKEGRFSTIPYMLERGWNLKFSDNDIRRGSITPEYTPYDDFKYTRDNCVIWETINTADHEPEWRLAKKFLGWDKHDHSLTEYVSVPRIEKDIKLLADTTANDPLIMRERPWLWDKPLIVKIQSMPHTDDKQVEALIMVHNEEMKLWFTNVPTETDLAWIKNRPLVYFEVTATKNGYNPRLTYHKEVEKQPW